MKRLVVITAVFAVFALLTFFVLDSAAWVQTQRPGSDGGLVYLAWNSSCYHYSIHEKGSDDIDLTELRQLVRESFNEWEDVSCSYFGFVETELAHVDEVGFNHDKGNVNLLIWREQESQWPTSQSVTALTTTSFDAVDGTILDSDIEFNGAYFLFGNQDSYPEDTFLMDMRSTITHEIGHALGLDHSQDSEATMDSSSLPGETEKRSIEQDDIDGVCTIYPLSDDPGICEEPLCGLDLTGDSTVCLDSSGSESCNCSTVGYATTGFQRLFIRQLFF